MIALIVIENECLSLLFSDFGEFERDFFVNAHDSS